VAELHRPPAGSTIVLESRGRAECLDFINKNWTDMRPKSLIEKMNADESTTNP
jgi:MbtH protein